MERGRIAIVTRPPGEDDLAEAIEQLSTTGIDVLVSALEPVEQQELGLSAEKEECESRGIRFLNYPIVDRAVPQSFTDLKYFLEPVLQAFGEGRYVAFHCRAGIGRSVLLAASLLAFQGLAPSDSFALIESARGVRVPDTEEQKDFVENLYRTQQTI